MGARIRADLAGLPTYVPGRTITGATKLASNEVSAGPLPSVVDAIATAGAEINRYPDTTASGLVRRLATFLDVPEEAIAVGCGSVTLCEQVVQATCGPDDEVLFAWRSFEMYPIIPQVVGTGQRTVPLREDHTHDLDAMADAITPHTRVVFVCSPNNPTGPAVRRAELDSFLDRVPDGVLVVLDEAYREFVTDPDVPDGLDYVRQGRDVAVLRTFSKAYGLAGLRVGYCVSTERVATALRKVYLPFSVNSLAQAAAIASLDASEELLARCRGIADERGRVRDTLVTLGYQVPESQANFVWLPLGEATPAFVQHCLDHKLVVRGLGADGVRVTIGTPDENDAFLAAARAFTG